VTVLDPARTDPPELALPIHFGGRQFLPSHILKSSFVSST
jgi:hypothetical protein